MTGVVHAVTHGAAAPPGEGVARTWPLGPRTGVPAALGAGAAWLWLLAPGVVPRPGALAALLAAAAEVPGAPLLAARVVAPDGSLDPAAAPWPRVLDKEQAIAGAAHARLALRAAPAGALLVSRAAVLAAGPPTGPRLLGWTARLLADAPGWLVPAAVADATAPRPPEPEARLLVAPGLSPDERLWLAFRLARGRGRRAGRAGR